MKLISKENYYLIFILFIFVLEAFLFFVENKKLEIDFLNEEIKVTKIQNVLFSTKIDAKAISIYDQTSNKKIYGKNDEVKLPIASLVKIMTIVVSLNDFYQRNDNNLIFISKNSLMEEGDYGFFINEKFNINDLAKFTLIGSSNDGASALAENTEYFLGKINNKAKKIGMENSMFFNSTGLDINEKISGAYASAQDVNIMAMYSLKAYPEIFDATTLPEINIKSESGFTHKIKNTNVILEKIPNILFSKTGFSPLAGGNLCVIFKDKNEHIIAITILGSSIDGRFLDMEKIVNTLYNLNYYEN